MLYKLQYETEHTKCNIRYQIMQNKFHAVIK